MLLCALTLLAVLAFAPDAFANFFTPQSGGSPNANRIANLYSITLYIAAVVFVGVEGTLLYMLVRFRARKGRVAKQIHGNTRLEIGWTLGATVILIALAILTFAELSAIRHPPNSSPGGLDISDGSQYVTTGDAIHPPKGRYMTIQVNGQQFTWGYSYLGFGKQPRPARRSPYHYYQLVVPTNTTVVLKVVSKDVVHSWWIPKLGGKVQAVPGYVNWSWFKISKARSFFGQCSFLCGRGHARMTAEVTAVSPAKFLTWLNTQQKYISRPPTSPAPRCATSESRGQVRRGRGREPVRS